MPLSQYAFGSAVFGRDTAGRTTETMATISLCAVIALVPLPFGSMNPKIIAVWVVLLSFIALLSSLGKFRSRDFLFLTGFAVIAVAWISVVGEQITIAPLFADELVDPIWDKTANILRGDLAGRVTIASNQPYLSAGSQILCWLAMVCGYLIGRKRNAAYLLLHTFAATGLLYAVYGITASVFWPDYLLWLPRFNYLNALVITFVNPNVAAVYLGSCALVWLLLLAKEIEQASRMGSSNWRNLANALFSQPSRWTVLCFGASFITISAMFMTVSRAGSILSLLAIYGALAVFLRRKVRSKAQLFAPLAIAAVVVVLTLYIFGSRVNQKFDAEGLFDAGRWTTYLSTLDIIRDHPWLGTGLGTFIWSFPGYRKIDASIFGIWGEAHSTSLEIASEMGVPFVTGLAIAWLIVYIVLAKGMSQRKRDQILPISAFWVSALAIIHSQIDFSMQVPGVSVVICALIGMGLAQSSRLPRLTKHLSGSRQGCTIC